jgi:hypothetical protein
MDKNLFYSKFYFMPVHVSSTWAHYQEVKIVLYGLWYHQTYRWPSGARGFSSTHWNTECMFGVNKTKEKIIN